MTLLALLLACGSSPDPVEAPAPAPVEAPEPAEAPAPAAPEAPASKRLNLNTASSEELATIPGMTEKMVHEFEEYRPYKSIRQFRKEIGKYVSPDMVKGWEPHVYVPVDPNGSDPATLQQLPGVGKAQAKALVEGRPYSDAAAFRTALEAQVGADDAEAGAALLAE